MGRRCILLFYLFATVFSSCLAQDQKTQELRAAYNARDWQKVINLSTDLELGANDLFKVGFAHYVLEDYELAYNFFLFTRKLDPYHADAYLYSGLLSPYPDSVGLFFRAAFKLQPDNTYIVRTFLGYLIEKGEDKELLSLLDSYLEKEETDYSIYLLYAQHHLSRDQADQALELMYKGVYEGNGSQNDLEELLYTIARLEYDFENYWEANDAIEAKFELNPKDLMAIPLKIRIEFALERLDRAFDWKIKLYKAHQYDQLPESLENGFYFDRIYVDDLYIRAFESYEDNSTIQYIKYSFEITREWNEKHLFDIVIYHDPLNQSREYYNLGIQYPEDNRIMPVEGFMYDRVMDYVILKKDVIRVSKRYQQ